MSEIDTTLKKFSKNLNKAIGDVIYLQMMNAARSLLEDAMAQKEYENLTGNTLTSLSVGLYREGRVSVLNIRKVLGLKDPSIGKISGAGTFYEFNLYDSGRKKKLWGKLLSENFLPTDEDFGYNTAMNFLQSYHPKEKYALVMCTGTEYSTFLERTKHLNVLTETYQNVRTLFFKNLVRI